MSSERTHPIVTIETLALVAIGGFAGSNLRYFVLTALPEVTAILLVNVVGSALLGFIVYELRYVDLLDRASRIAFTTGFLSSLTTYSTFALQVALADSPALLLLVIAGNYGLAIVGVLLGRRVARRIGGDSP